MISFLYSSSAFASSDGLEEKEGTPPNAVKEASLFSLRSSHSVCNKRKRRGKEKVISNSQHDKKEKTQLTVYQFFRSCQAPRPLSSSSASSGLVGSYVVNIPALRYADLNRMLSFGIGRPFFSR